MSYMWGAIKTDKNSVLIGAIFWGVAITLIIGLPAWFLIDNYNIEISRWLGIIVAICLFLVITFSIYKSKCKK